MAGLCFGFAATFKQTSGAFAFLSFCLFLLIDKGGIQAAQSMHVRFLFDEMTFRFTYRINGQPVPPNKPITPAKGTNTVGPFVALDTRA